MSQPATFDHDAARALYATGDWTLAALARLFGVSATRMWQIMDPERKRKTERASLAWAHRNYRVACAECGTAIWKRGNAATTGLCRQCLGRSRRTVAHGTESSYRSGCRCEWCRMASADARRGRRHADIEATRAYDRARRRKTRAA